MDRDDDYDEEVHDDDDDQVHGDEPVHDDVQAHDDEQVHDDDQVPHAAKLVELLLFLDETSIRGVVDDDVHGDDARDDDVHDDDHGEDDVYDETASKFKKLNSIRFRDDKLLKENKSGYLLLRPYYAFVYKFFFNKFKVHKFDDFSNSTDSIEICFHTKFIPHQTFQFIFIGMVKCNLYFPIR